MKPPVTKVGVVGAGYWGPNLIRNAAELGILDSVCDRDRAALGAINARYPDVVTLESFDDLLRRPVDGVIIATPAQLHAPMALQALANGKHVFVEKPLALTLAQAEEIARVAAAARLQVFVGHLLLYHPAFKKLRAVISEGTIGRLWHIRSRRTSLGKLRAHENVWWSFAPHDVALIIALMADEPVGVTAAPTAQRVGTPDDVTYADFQFPEGRSAHIEVCWLDPHKNARLDVFGSSGVITLEDSRQGSILTLTRCGIDPDKPSAVRRAEPEQLTVEHGEPLRAELEAFVQCVVSGRPAETDASEGIAVIRALTMADDAARRTTMQSPVAV